MRAVTVHFAKTNLSKILHDVENGEEILIARGSKAVAKLVALKPRDFRSRVGFMGDKIRVWPLDTTAR